MEFDIVLVDINCIGHLAYQYFWGDDADPEEVDEYILRLQELYFKFPFLKAKEYLVFGDSPPYWRTRVLSRISGTVYKGTRSERSTGKANFLNRFRELAGAIKKPHFEADDLIAAYTLSHPNKKTCILTVDSDLIQLASGNVTWFCCKGYFPQVRSESNGNLKLWLDKKFTKLSKKRIGHLDTSKASSIVEWKVIYGDLKSDNIPAGEEFRQLIDLQHPTRHLKVIDSYPNFIQECEQHIKKVQGLDRPWTAIEEYEEKYACSFITKMPGESDWGFV